MVIGVLVRFDRKDWALVGLILVLNILLRLQYLPFFLVELARDPFGVIMELVVGGVGGAYVGVYVLKWVFNWYRALPDAE